MRIAGALRVKNEARWILRSLRSILPICETVHVFDDNSTDDTRKICRALPGVKVYESPFNTTDEARDKNLLLDKVDAAGGADWLIMIDGDEVLEPGKAWLLDGMIKATRKSCLSLPVLYLWDREDQTRVDGVYGDFMRESAFRYQGERFQRYRRRVQLPLRERAGRAPEQPRILQLSIASLRIPSQSRQAPEVRMVPATRPEQQDRRRVPSYGYRRRIPG